MPAEAQHRLVDRGSESNAPAAPLLCGSGDLRDIRLEVLSRSAPTLGSSRLAQARAKNLADWVHLNSGSASFFADGAFTHALLPEPVTLLVADREESTGTGGVTLSPALSREVRKLSVCIEAEPVEDGVSHPGERIIASLLNSYGENEVATAVLEAIPCSMSASALRLIGRVDLRNPGVRRRLVEAGLGSADVETRDAAAQAVECWEDVACAELLARHNEPVPWLAGYIRDILSDLRD